MAGARSIGMVMAGGVVLFAAGFLLGQWTAAPGLRPPGEGDPEAPGGAGAPHALDGAAPRTAQSAVGARDPAAGVETGARDGGSVDPGRGAPEGAVAGGEGKEPAAGGTGGAGIPDRRVTSVAASPAGGERAQGGLAPPPARGADAPGRVEPPPPYALPERIRGRLLDAFTGMPIPGAKVSLLWEIGDGTMSGGVATADPDAEGNFTLEPGKSMGGNAAWVLAQQRERRYRTEADVLADVSYTLRASAKGYETTEIGDPGTGLDIRLQPEGKDRLTGSIRVDARWPDDVRYGGRLLVEAGSPGRQGFSQWALPDPDGTFLLVGIAPGKWGLRVAGRSHTGEDLVVPEAGEARIKLRVPRTGVQEPQDAPKGEPREVVVSCGVRDPGPNAFVRAEAKPGLFFRSEVVASSAAFPSLPAGKWTFVLQAAERTEERFTAEVPPDPASLRLSFPDPAPEAAAPK